jgi:2-methylisocitrate lyase-like PEP mutase family enzyme
LTQREKAERFRTLHSGAPFVIPNPWDAGSARMLEALGFEALATTSSGFAFTLGRLDGDVTLDEVVAHTAALAEASSLPVSVDLENGYGAEPEAVALAIALSRRPAPSAGRSRTGISMAVSTTVGMRSSVSPPRSRPRARSTSRSR